MSGNIQCPSCQKEYRWKPELAGKRARCKCGNAITIPNDDPASAIGVQDSEDVYDVHEPAAVAAPTPVRAVPPPLQGTIGLAPVAAPTAPTTPRIPTTIANATRANQDRCQACGSNAPTKYVEFHQNVGALVVRRHRWVRGKLCKSCINDKFWKMTGTTLAVGWLGHISLIIAPIYILNNVFRYLGCITLPKSHNDQ